MVCVRWMCVCKACDWCIYQACQVSFSLFNTEICGNKKKVFANSFLEEFLVKKTHVSADFCGGQFRGGFDTYGVKTPSAYFCLFFSDTIGMPDIYYMCVVYMWEGWVTLHICIIR